MTDEIIKDFNSFITDLCGKEQPPKQRKRSKFPSYPDRDIEEFLHHRWKELYDHPANCQCHTYECTLCDEKYEIFTDRQILQDDNPYNHYTYEPYTFDDNPYRSISLEVKRKRYYCFNCGRAFFLHGNVKHIRNIGSTKIEFSNGDNMINKRQEIYGTI